MRLLKKFLREGMLLFFPPPHRFLLDTGQT